MAQREKLAEGSVHPARSTARGQVLVCEGQNLLGDRARRRRATQPSAVLQAAMRRGDAHTGRTRDWPGRSADRPAGDRFRGRPDRTFPKPSSTRSTVSPRFGNRDEVIIVIRTFHARLRVAGIAARPLPAGFWSCAMLRRSASMRLITRRGAANVGFSSRTAPACLAFRCASSASS